MVGNRPIGVPTGVESIFDATCFPTALSAGGFVGAHVLPEAQRSPLGGRGRTGAVDPRAAAFQSALRDYFDIRRNDP